MGYKSNGIEWAQPQRAIGVRSHGGEVAAGSVDYRAPIAADEGLSDKARSMTLVAVL
jgi:hypothetical protein